MSHKASKLLTSTNFSEIAKILKNEGQEYKCVFNVRETIGSVSSDDGVMRFYSYGNKYVFYHGRIRLLIDDGVEKLVKVSILHDESKWEICPKENSDEWVIDSPEARCYTVYTYCYIKLPTGRMMSDERYTRGTWDGFVYKRMRAIFDRIYSYKEKNRYEQMYYDSENR